MNAFSERVVHIYEMTMKKLWQSVRFFMQVSYSPTILNTTRQRYHECYGGVRYLKQV